MEERTKLIPVEKQVPPNGPNGQNTRGPQVQIQGDSAPPAVDPNNQTARRQAQLAETKQDR